MVRFSLPRMRSAVDIGSQAASFREVSTFSSKPWGERSRPRGKKNSPNRGHGGGWVVIQHQLQKKGFLSHALSKSIRNAFFGQPNNLHYIFIYLFKVNLLSDSHGFTPPETEVTPKNASHLLRHPRNVWRSDPPWAPPHARPLRSQEGLGGLEASAVDPEAQGPVRDLSTKTSSLPVDG